MFDILAYLYENCHHADLSQDSARVVKKLSAAGFDDSEISEALAWLDGMARIPQRMILKQPELNRRYTRILLTEQLRRQFNELLPYGLALEGLAITDDLSSGAIKATTSRSFLPWSAKPADYAFPPHLEGIVDPQTGDIDEHALSKRIEELRPHANV